MESDISPLFHMTFFGSHPKKRRGLKAAARRLNVNRLSRSNAECSIHSTDRQSMIEWGLNPALRHPSLKEPNNLSRRAVVSAAAVAVLGASGAKLKQPQAVADISVPPTPEHDPQRFEFVKFLGQGGFGMTVLAKAGPAAHLLPPSRHAIASNVVEDSKGSENELLCVVACFLLLLLLFCSNLM
jgi:hypothetical protein